MPIDRRGFLSHVTASMLSSAGAFALAAQRERDNSPLKITGLRITPIALPDPPLLAASGCHGPYFLRNIIQLETDAKIIGIGETRGGQQRTTALERARKLVVGQNAFSYRRFARRLIKIDPDIYAGIELACLDACGKATKRRVCELLGGPVRDSVEFAAYLFYRYAADNKRLLADRRIVDRRGRGKRALDDWGEVRTPKAMAAMAERFRKRWGFRVFKLKAGVLPPKVELETMLALNGRFKGKLPLRIDPNGRWRLPTAVQIAGKMKKINLEYYEDPVLGQKSMAAVRRRTKLRMATNSCVTRFQHIPEAIKNRPIDVVLCDHHFWGGIPACQELGRMCQTLGWGLSQHSNNHAGITMAAMIHLGAAVSQLTYASDTHYVWLPPGSDIIRGNNLPIVKGCMSIPKGHGLGVELDKDKLARAHATYRKCGMRERQDDRTMRMVVPGWKRTLF